MSTPYSHRARSPQTEALRHLNQAKTLYPRLVEKNRAAEEAYREKIIRLEQALTELQEEEAA